MLLLFASEPDRRSRFRPTWGPSLIGLSQCTWRARKRTRTCRSHPNWNYAGQGGTKQRRGLAVALSVARTRTGRRAAPGDVSPKRRRFSPWRQTSARGCGHRAADARPVGDYRRHQGEPPYLPEPGQDPGRSLEDDGPCSLADAKDQTTVQTTSQTIRGVIPHVGVSISR